MNCNSNEHTKLSMIYLLKLIWSRIETYIYHISRGTHEHSIYVFMKMCGGDMVTDECMSECVCLNVWVNVYLNDRMNVCLNVWVNVCLNVFLFRTNEVYCRGNITNVCTIKPIPPLRNKMLKLKIFLFGWIQQLLLFFARSTNTKSRRVRAISVVVLTPARIWNNTFHYVCNSGRTIHEQLDPSGGKRNLHFQRFLESCIERSTGNRPKINAWQDISVNN